MAIATGPSSVGIVAGTPAPNQAAATGAPAPPAGVAGTGSAVAPVPSATGSVVPFKGAAVRTGSSSLLVSMVVAAAGLFVLA